MESITAHYATTAFQEREQPSRECHEVKQQTKDNQRQINDISLLEASLIGPAVSDQRTRLRVSQDKLQFAFGQL